MGCKNMDQLLAEHYNQMMKDDRNSSESVFASHKAKVKVFDQVEKQRKMLSANEESHISVEALFDDYELSYNMTRREFEKIVAPVLQEIRKGIRSIKGRMPPKYFAYSLELVGGASRIPFIGSIIRETFGTDPSRTLNQSESVARGAAIYGAVASKLLRMDYLLPNCNLIDICACWNPTGRDFFGENETQYKKREVVFRSNT